MIRWVEFSLLAVVGICAPDSTHAQSSTDVGEGDESSPSPLPSRPRVREGSWLEKDDPIPPLNESPSALDAFLAVELEKHYRRVARLDRIESLIAAEDSGRLRARVEHVRRREMQRFRRTMKAFHRQSEARRLVGFP